MSFGVQPHGFATFPEQTSPKNDNFASCFEFTRVRRLLGLPLPFDVRDGLTYASSAIVSLGGLSRLVTHELRHILEFRIVVEVVLSERPAAVLRDRGR